MSMRLILLTFGAEKAEPLPKRKWAVNNSEESVPAHDLPNGLYCYF
jgi:hypothetical protein